MTTITPEDYRRIWAGQKKPHKDNAMTFSKTELRMGNVPARITASEYRMLLAREQKPVKHKYNAKATFVDGIRFDSKAEAKRFEELKRLQAAGEVRFFIRQPSFDLPGGVKYRADFLIVRNGSVTVEDVKGMKTAAYRIKKRQVEALYGVKIVEV